MSNVVDTAKSYIGKVKYQYGVNNIDSGAGDCSAYTQTVYKKATGIDIGRSTEQQLKVGKEVQKSDLKEGDLVLFKNTYNSNHTQGVSHVGIYIGNNQFIHNSDNGVMVSDLNSDYYKNHYLTARRVTDSNGNAINTSTGSSSGDSDTNNDEDTNLFGSIVVVVLIILCCILAVIFFFNSIGFKKPDVAGMVMKAKGGNKVEQKQ